MNVLLIHPWFPYSSVRTFEEPLGILYLASALLETRHKVDVADLTFNHELEGLKERVSWADVVGISAPTPLFGTATEVLNYIKKINPKIHTLVGGPHATADPEATLSAGFDIAVIGEGEVTIVELVEKLSTGGRLDEVAGIAYLEDGNLQVTSQRPFIANVNEIAPPARQFIDYSRYRRLGIISMRGCPYRCLFCKPREDLEKTYRLIKTIKPFNWHVHMTTPMFGSHLYDRTKAEDRLDSNADYSSFEPTGNIYRLHMPMKVDHLSASDTSGYRDRINSYMKFRVLLSCIVNFRIWMEILFSRGLRTIAFNFIRSHIGLRGWKVRLRYPMARSVRQKLK